MAWPLKARRWLPVSLEWPICDAHEVNDSTVPVLGDDATGNLGHVRLIIKLSPAGSELSAVSSGKTASAESAAAVSHAGPPTSNEELAAVIAVWHSLRSEQRAAVLKLIFGAELGI